MTRLKVLLAAVGVLIVCAIAFWVDASGRGVAGATPGHAVVGPTTAADTRTRVLSGESGGRSNAPAGTGKRLAGANPDRSEQLASLAYSPSIDEALRVVSRTQDTLVQEYVLGHAGRLCIATKSLIDHERHLDSVDLFDAGTKGARTAAIEPLFRASRPEIDRIAARCHGYEGSAMLIEWMQHAAQTTGWPLASLRWSLPNVASGDTGNAVRAREALERVLAAPDGVNLLPLAGTQLAYQNAASLIDELPPAEQAFALVQPARLGAAAIEIAACRSGAACGERSLPRDRICVAYLECNGGDVETAYRRLAERHGIPFDAIDRAATRVQRAIARRDVEALIPASAR